MYRVENGAYYNKQEKAFSCPVCHKLVCRRVTNPVFFTYHLRWVPLINLQLSRLPQAGLSSNHQHSLLHLSPQVGSPINLQLSRRPQAGLSSNHQHSLLHLSPQVGSSLFTFSCPICHKLVCRGITNEIFFTYPLR